MAEHVVQFMKNWYKVFPEFRIQDVSWRIFFSRIRVELEIDPFRALPLSDLHLRGELCWTVHSIHRYVSSHFLLLSPLCDRLMLKD